jgi:hypothetical protein
MHPSSRVTYKAVLLPERAHLRGYLGLKEEAWDKQTDGVFFSIGISADGVFTEVLKETISPSTNPNHRGWVPFDIDLAKWTGKQVEIVFNTRPSPPGYQPNDLYDFAVIGDPAIIVPHS